MAMACNELSERCIAPKIQASMREIGGGSSSFDALTAGLARALHHEARDYLMRDDVDYIVGRTDVPFKSMVAAGFMNDRDVNHDGKIVRSELEAPRGGSGVRTRKSR